MSSVAVIGGDTPLGRRVVAALSEDDHVERLVVLGARVEPQPGIEAHAVDVAATDLKPYLDGVDVVVACATRVEPMPERDLLDRMTVATADNVLQAAGGARRIVLVSTTSVYGAWANNAKPLTEAALVRPNPGFDPATRAAEIERRAHEWSADHPDCTLVILRVAPVVAPDGNELLATLTAGRPPVVATNSHPAVQVVHVDDVARAVVLAATGPLAGVYNVAADDALSEESVAVLLPGRRQLRVPEELIARGLDRLWQAGAGDVPASVLPYLRESWVVSNARLREVGWAPRYSNAEAIQQCLPQAAYALPPEARRIVRTAAIAAGVAVAGVALLAWRRSRRRGR